ncbi:Membrane protein insertase YidC [bacterium HR07]|uniref:Membrane protein insertase YidC n=1 Tax=Acetithermum autotrophicum TaxID=1446466 RepID=H5SRE7_ACEAU|nr:preprotein translocase subunit YidC [Candidatus Acetothermum autotrophicum]GBC76164.1 Membrane protein insertase YidC [bacterium HR07]
MSIRFLVFVLLGVFAFSAQAQDPRTQIVTRWLGEHSPRELEVKTGLVSYVFSEAGGTLRSVYLYFSAPWGNPPAEILPDVTVKPEDLSRLYAEGATFPFALTVGSVSPEAPYQTEILPSENPKIQRVTFTHQSEALKITKTFTVINAPYYTVDVELRLENLSAEELSLPQGVQMLVGAGVHDTRSEARFLFDGVRATEILQNYKNFEGLGFVGNTFLLWLSTDPAQNIRPWVGTDAKGRQILGVRSEALTLAPGERRTYRFTLYAGRLNLVFLEQAGLQHVTEHGLWSQALAGVTKFLNLLYAYTGNYGWALILFTLIIRLLMYPLTRAQFHSMAKMKEIQPKLEKLQARYPSLTQLRAMYPKMSEDELKRRARENREELTKKQMELFRKEGVNPMGGCLPALLQIPIFLLLWRVVLYSAEAIHLSPGFLWMSDLSQHDSLYIIVALTVLAQIAQGKLTPVPSAGGQSQAMTWLFPVVFGFLLKDLSAGLWLHYFVSTLVQVGQQLVVMWELRRRPKPAEPEPSESEEAPAVEAAHDGPKDRSSD